MIASPFSARGARLGPPPSMSAPAHDSPAIGTTPGGERLASLLLMVVGTISVAATRLSTAQSCTAVLIG